MQELSNHALLGRYEAALTQVEQVRTWAGNLEQEIIRRIREAGATGIPDEVFECVLESKTEYDPGRLLPLLEVLSNAELAKAYTPAHEETRMVASKWDFRKLLPIARLHGDSVLRVVEEAKVVAGQRLRFKRKDV